MIMKISFDTENKLINHHKMILWLVDKWPTTSTLVANLMPFLVTKQIWNLEKILTDRWDFSATLELIR